MWMICLLNNIRILETCLFHGFFILSLTENSFIVKQTKKHFLEISCVESIKRFRKRWHGISGKIISDGNAIKIEVTDRWFASFTDPT